MFELLYFTR